MQLASLILDGKKLPNLNCIKTFCICGKTYQNIRNLTGGCYYTGCSKLLFTFSNGYNSRKKNRTMWNNTLKIKAKIMPF